MIPERIVRLLRGEPREYYIIDGETKLIKPELYPHGKDKVPILCETEEDLPTYKGYVSGFRSIIKVSEDGYVVKLKGIGIPFKDVKPIYKNNTIYTYYFTNEYIGTGQLMWGFMTPKEAEEELNNMIMLRELRIPVPEPIGLGYYDRIKLLKIKDRYELTNKIMSGGRGELIKMLEGSTWGQRGACIFYRNVSDVRADEILYGLLMPKVEKIINVKEVKEYLKWLGSSCGYNLRLLHENGIIHGTMFDASGLGIYTNSHLANHVVGLEETYITDFHLTRKMGGKEFERMKMEEYYALWHIMNPLPSAEKFIMSQIKHTTILNAPEVISQMHTWEGFQAFNEIVSLHGGYYRPENIYEEFTESLIDGIEYGYNKMKKYELEGKAKRRMLMALSILKDAFLELYGLPKGMERGREVVGIVMDSKKIDEKTISRKISEVKSRIEELL
ncbi:MAG: hypothetical protein NDF52_07215 [archaeon YNP-WB-062]|jgi:serine/threonine protein kinase|nr:hypothetical protein [Candidatus Culexarchaeum yellowstonense]